MDGFKVHIKKRVVYTLPETNIDPENKAIFEPLILKGELLVSGRVIESPVEVKSCRILITALFRLPIAKGKQSNLVAVEFADRFFSFGWDIIKNWLRKQDYFKID